MKKKKLSSVLGLIFMTGFTLSLFTVDTYAQNDSAGVKNNDKDLANRRGVADSLASKDKPKEVFDPKTGQMVKVAEEVDPNKPTPLKMGIGLGSIPVAYIVLKYL